MLDASLGNSNSLRLQTHEVRYSDVCVCVLCVSVCGWVDVCVCDNVPSQCG